MIVVHEICTYTEVDGDVIDVVECYGVCSHD